MSRGLRNIYDAGKVVEVDGQTEMTVWGEGKCNTIIGTDGLLFTPLHGKMEPLSFFIKQICSSIHLNHKKDASFRGIETSIYINQFEDFVINNMTCYCRNPNQCPVRGTMDLFPCVKVPITISHPHFYDGDPSLLENVASGLEPHEEQHEFFLNMEIVLFYVFCVVKIYFV